MSYEEQALQSLSAVTKYTLMTGEDIRNLPPVQWLVKGIVPRAGVSMIYGDSGSGKTFLALDLAMAVAQGELWFGYRTKAAPVIYFPLEGAGVQNRITAWEVHNDKTLPAGVRVVKEREFSLLDPANTAGIVQAVNDFAGVSSGALVIIDTMARAVAGHDENDASVMGLAIAAAERIASEVGGAVLLVHHTGKDGKTVRGSSVLRAAAETMLFVESKGPGLHSWKPFKLKDGGKGPDAERAFTLKVVVLGQDDDHEDVRSCVVQRSEATEGATKEIGLGANQGFVLAALKAALAVAAEGLAYAPPGVRALTTADASSTGRAALTVGGVPKKSLATRYKEAITGLLAKGILKTAGTTNPPAGGFAEPQKVVWLA